MNSIGDWLNGNLTATRRSVELDWVFSVYRQWCERNNCRPVDLVEFEREVQQVFPGVLVEGNYRTRNFFGCTWKRIRIFDRRSYGPLFSLSPAVKTWLDNVLVPAMVQNYLAAEDSNGLRPLRESVQ
jgi:hypothetical protein